LHCVLVYLCIFMVYFVYDSYTDILIIIILATLQQAIALSVLY